jgi:hypothetical protein
MLNDLLWAGERVAVIDWQSGGKTILFDTATGFVNSWRNTTPDGQRLIPLGHVPGGFVTSHRETERPSETVPGRAYPTEGTLRLLTPTMDSLGADLFELPPSVLYGSTTTHGLDWPLFDPVRGFGFDARGNFYRSAGTEYRIDVRDLDDAHVRSIRREYEPIPLGQADVEAATSSASTSRRRSPAPTPGPPWESYWSPATVPSGSSGRTSASPPSGGRCACRASTASRRWTRAGTSSGPTDVSAGT